MLIKPVEFDKDCFKIIIKTPFSRIMEHIHCICSIYTLYAIYISPTEHNNYTFRLQVVNERDCHQTQFGNKKNLIAKMLVRNYTNIISYCTYVIVG